MVQAIGLTAADTAEVLVAAAPGAAFLQGEALEFTLKQPVVPPVEWTLRNWRNDVSPWFPIPEIARLIPIYFLPWTPPKAGWPGRTTTPGGRKTRSKSFPKSPAVPVCRWCVTE